MEGRCDNEWLFALSKNSIEEAIDVGVHMMLALYSFWEESQEDYSIGL